MQPERCKDPAPKAIKPTVWVKNLCSAFEPRCSGRQAYHHTDNGDNFPHRLWNCVVLFIHAGCSPRRQKTFWIGYCSLRGIRVWVHMWTQQPAGWLPVFVSNPDTLWWGNSSHNAFFFIVLEMFCVAERFWGLREIRLFKIVELQQKHLVSLSVKKTWGCACVYETHLHFWRSKQKKNSS